MKSNEDRWRKEDGDAEPDFLLHLESKQRRKGGMSTSWFGHSSAA